MNKMFVGISLAVLVYATSQGTGVRPVFADAAGSLPVAIASAKPIITNFVPTTALTGTLITITGINFDDVAVVLFGSTHAKFITTDSEHVTAIVPEGADCGPITLQTIAGKTITLVDFKVGKPAQIIITAMSPQSGNMGMLVQVGGKGFESASSVKFNGVPSQFVINSDTLLTAVVPSGASSGPIKVSGLGGTAVTPTFSASE